MMYNRFRLSWIDFVRAVTQVLKLITECDSWLDQHPDGFSAMPADPSPEHDESPVEQRRAYYQAALRVSLASGAFQGTSWSLLTELFFLKV